MYQLPITASLVGLTLIACEGITCKLTGFSLFLAAVTLGILRFKKLGSEQLILFILGRPEIQPLLELVKHFTTPFPPPTGGVTMVLSENRKYWTLTYQGPVTKYTIPLPYQERPGLANTFVPLKDGVPQVTFNLPNGVKFLGSNELFDSDSISIFDISGEKVGETDD